MSESRRELTEEERAIQAAEKSAWVTNMATREIRAYGRSMWTAAREFYAERVVPVSSEPTPFDDERSLVLESVPAREIVKGDDIMCSDLVRRVRDVKPYVPEVGGFSFDLGDRWRAYGDAQSVWRVVPARPVVEASGEGEAMEAARRVVTPDSPPKTAFAWGWDAAIAWAASTRVPDEAAAKRLRKEHEGDVAVCNCAFPTDCLFETGYKEAQAEVGPETVICCDHSAIANPSCEPAGDGCVTLADLIDSYSNGAASRVPSAPGEEDGPDDAEHIRIGDSPTTLCGKAVEQLNVVALSMTVPGWGAGCWTCLQRAREAWKAIGEPNAAPSSSAPEQVERALREVVEAFERYKPAEPEREGRVAFGYTWEPLIVPFENARAVLDAVSGPPEQRAVDLGPDADPDEAEYQETRARVIAGRASIQEAQGFIDFLECGAIPSGPPESDERATLGRIAAWASHHKDESKSGIRVTLGLIYEEATRCLGR